MPDQLDEVGVTEAVAGTRTYVFYEAAVLGTNTAQQGSPSTAPRIYTWGSEVAPPPPTGWGPQASAFDLWNPYPLTYEKGNHVLYEHYHYEARATDAGGRDLRGR